MYTWLRTTCPSYIYFYVRYSREGVSGVRGTYSRWQGEGVRTRSEGDHVSSLLLLLCAVQSRCAIALLYAATA